LPKKEKNEVLGWYRFPSLGGIIRFLVIRCSNIHDSPLQITYHRFLKLVYPDAAETEKSGCIMLNELIRNSPETPYSA